MGMGIGHGLNDDPPSMPRTPTRKSKTRNSQNPPVWTPVGRALINETTNILGYKVSVVESESREASTFTWSVSGPRGQASGAVVCDESAPLEPKHLEARNFALAILDVFLT